MATSGAVSRCEDDRSRRTVPLPDQSIVQEIRVPLSSAQRQIWLHLQLSPEAHIYNEPVTIKYQGAIDVAVVKRALNEIVRRHHAWRSVFKVVEGEVVQIVRPPFEVQLRVLDLSHLSATEQEAEARRLASEDVRLPFQLSEGPLFRALLVRFNESDSRIFFALHHIIFDGYSITHVLLPEIKALYEAFSHGHTSPLSEPQVQYSDFAPRERDYLSAGEWPKELAYWREQLSGDLPALQLPCDYPRPAVQDFRGASHALRFSRELSSKLKSLSQKQRTTLFVTLLTAFALLLHRYSGMEEIVVGTVSSQRKRLELENLIGYLVNPIVLRVDLAGDPTFTELMRTTREVVLGALSNDNVPFVEVVNALHPTRNLHTNPLFQVLFTLEPPKAAESSPWSVSLTESEGEAGVSHFDLSLELDDRSEGIVGRLNYSTDLFTSDTISAMADSLRVVLQNIVENPERCISGIVTLGKHERQRLCVEWNQTAADYPSTSCLHELVTEQGAVTPNSPAVIERERQITYEELERASNRVASYLSEIGLTPETPVGLCFQPCIEMISGTLGVLKAGGACVPLDPSFPTRRLAEIIEDLGLRILLTSVKLGQQFEGMNLNVVCLDSDWFEGSSNIPGSPPRLVRPQDLAYIICTSGSTGRPKGVELTHRNLVQSTFARRLYYGTEAGRFLLLSSFAVDSSLAGIFGTLTRGGTLVLLPGSVQSNLTRIPQQVRNQEISELLCVPSLYSFLLEQAEAGDLASLRTVIVAGETCPPALVNRHYERLPEVALYNEYGPTETSVWATVHRCAAGTARKLVPIGRPIANARIYVLDSSLNPVLVGVPGELYIGGAGVARGYVNRASETEQRFIPDPFVPGAENRLYKTGDQGRFLSDGTLELMGRLDNQVKLRGFRIELEEVEAAISAKDGVRGAAVAIRENEQGEKCLNAFVAVSDPDRFCAGELRNFLSQRLPDAMVPSSFVPVKQLPLSASGKLDRHALPREFPHSQPARTVSHNDIQKQLSILWKDVLGEVDLGIDDNFFDLGGNSLLAARLATRMEEHWKIKVPLATIFRLPTIRQMAELLGGRSEAPCSPAILSIQANGRKTPLFWVRGGSYLMPLARHLGPEQPLLGLQLPLADAMELRPPYRLEEIAAALVRRLVEVQPKGPYYLAGWCDSGVLAYEMATQLIFNGERVEFLGLFDSQNPEYYRHLSVKSRAEMLSSKCRFHFKKMRHGGTRGFPRFVRERISGMAGRVNDLRWRIRYREAEALGESQLHDIGTIVHPAFQSYRPKTYAGSMVFFQSSDWPSSPQFNFAGSWKSKVRGNIEVHKVPGDHQTMFYQENAKALASKLQHSMMFTQRNQ